MDIAALLSPMIRSAMLCYLLSVIGVLDHSTGAGGAGGGGRLLDYTGARTTFIVNNKYECPIGPGKGVRNS